MRRRCWWILLLLTTAIVLTPILYIFNSLDKLLGVSAPQPVENIVYLDQGWSDEDIRWFYHASQGSMFPLECNWFLALEQPIMTFGYPAPPFREKSYLASQGFLYDDNAQKQALPTESVFKTEQDTHAYDDAYVIENEDDLPVGFAIDHHYVDPITQEEIKVVGLTCGACHTGQLNYKNKGIRIAGGASMANLVKLQDTLGVAMMMTACEPWYICDPFRFDRFAKKVLGSDYNAETKAELREKFNQRLQIVLAQARSDLKHPPKVVEGYGRLDALNRIANFVFGLELDEDNFQAVDAPVAFPHLWGISWFDWVQYNGSVKQPMTRNAGEALGVFSSINLKDPSQQLFQSSLEVRNLYLFEKMISGDKPFEGLRAPEWPEQILGAINQDKVKKGEALYRAKCMRCHLPPMDSEEICQPQYWTEPNEWGVRLLKLNLVNIDLLGTDGQLATDWATRFIDSQHLGLGKIKGEIGLPLTVEKAVELKYDEMGLTQEQRDEYNGKRKNLVRSPLCYKARPLEGIWATPPFLHNGSVPNLYQLLSPVAERDTQFYLTSLEFDPKYVGYKTDYVAGGYELDTREIGNHNTGHEFRALTAEEEKTWPRDEYGNFIYPYKGVLGTELAEYERWQLIEYLKTLKSRDLSTQTEDCPQAYIPPSQPKPEVIELCR